MTNDKVGATFHGGEDEPKHIEIFIGRGESEGVTLPHHTGIDMVGGRRYGKGYGKRDPLSVYSPVKGKVVGVSLSGFVAIRGRFRWFRKRHWWTISRLRDIQVKVGDKVDEGTLLGYMGVGR